MTDHSDLLNLLTLEPQLRQRLVWLLPSELQGRKQLLLQPSTAELQAVRQHLEAVQRLLTAVVPGWLRDDLLHGRLPGPRPVEATLLFADVTGFTARTATLSSLGVEGNERLTATLNELFATLLEGVPASGGDVLAFGGDAVLVAFSGANHAARAAVTALAMQERWEHRLAQPPSAPDEPPLRVKIGLASGPITLLSAGTSTRQVSFALGPALHEVDTVASQTSANGVGCAPSTATLLGLTLGQADDHSNALRDALSTRSFGPAVAPTQLAPLRLTVLLQQIGALAPFVPADLLRSLAHARDVQAGAGEQRRVVGMFVHLTGLCPLDSVTPLPAEVVASAERAVRQTLALIEQHRGVLARVDAYQDGLKILALFGAPVSREGDLLHALRAALELRATLQTPLRIGIEEGQVLAALVGAPQRYEYTLMGNAVNTAARLMSIGAAAQRDITVGANVWARIGRHLDAEQREVQLKGLGLTPCWVVRQLQDTSTDVPEDAPPLIGRTRELQALQQCAAWLQHGQPGAVLLFGEAGLGKTRLLGALRDLLPPQVRCIQVKAQRWGSYDLLRQVLQALHHLPSGPLHLTRALLGDWLKDHPVDLDTLWFALQPLLDQIEPPASAIEGEARTRLLGDAFRQILAAATARQPLALLLEDMHALDEKSLELVGLLLEVGWSGPLLLALTSRPPEQYPERRETLAELADRAVWGLGPQARLITLSGLEPGQDAALLDVLASDLSLEQRANILARAERNPLYLVEWLRVQANRLSEEAEAGTPPESLSALMVARIDALGSEEAKRLAGVAAVIGSTSTVVPAWLLRWVAAAENPAALSRPLQLLRDSHILQRTPHETEAGAGNQHQFTHSLLQHAAYELLTVERRRSYHARAAQAIERIDPAASDDSAKTAALAHHYYQAQRWPDALRFTLPAGQQALRVYSIQAAQRLLEQSLEIATRLQQTAERHEALLGLATLHSLRGEFSQAQERLTPILDGASDDAAGLREVHAVRLLAHIFTRTDQYQQAIAACQRGLSWALSDPKANSELPRLYEQLAEALMHSDRPEEATTAAQAALALLPPLSAAPAERARISMRLGTIYYRNDQLAQAIDELARALDLARPTGDVVLLAAVLNNLGAAYDTAGQYDSAMTNYTESLLLKRRINDRSSMADTLSNMGAICMFQGRFEQALDYLGQAQEQSAAIGALRTQGNSLLNIGLVHMQLKQFDQAKHFLQAALALFQGLDIPTSLAHCLYSLGDIALKHAKTEDALRLGQQAYQQASRVESAAFVFCALRVIGEAQTQLQAYTEAEQTLAAAWQIQADHDLDPFDVVLLHLASAKLAFAQGHWEEVKYHCAAGRELAEELNMPDQIAAFVELEASIRPSPPPTI